VDGGDRDVTRRRTGPRTQIPVELQIIPVELQIINSIWIRLINHALTFSC
jgi:hypothetical protein